MDLPPKPGFGAEVLPVVGEVVVGPPLDPPPANFDRVPEPKAKFLAPDKKFEAFVINESSSRRTLSISSPFMILYVARFMILAFLLNSERFQLN